MLLVRGPRAGKFLRAGPDCLRYATAGRLSEENMGINCRDIITNLEVYHHCARKLLSINWGGGHVVNSLDIISSSIEGRHK